MKMAVGIPVGEIMVREVVTTTPEENVAGAIKKLVAADVGTLVVIENSKPVGIITRGDILRAIANNLDLNKTKIADIMTSPVITAKPDIDIEDIARIMRDNRVKRIPIVDDNGNLVGIVSETDIIRVSPAVYEIVREREALGGV